MESGNIGIVPKFLGSLEKLLIQIHIETMKKEYKRPQIEVIKIEQSLLLPNSPHMAMVAKVVAAMPRTTLTRKRKKNSKVF